jgi:imidazoleglycerol-phosphate dehydratase
MARTATIKRTTKETDIALSINLDGTGVSTVQSGNGFMDHMLTLFAKHGLIDFELACKGDIEVDFHHSAEDIGICLGQALLKAVGDKKGIRRYGMSYVPMDESLARISLDLSGRPTLVYAVSLIDRTVGGFDCDLVEDFFKAVCDNAGITLHADLIRGRNSHHSIEGIFKAFGRALCEACSINDRAPSAINSTKGSL